MDLVSLVFSWAGAFILGAIFGRAFAPKLSEGEMFDAIVASRLADASETSARMKLKRELQSAANDVRPPSAE